MAFINLLKTTPCVNSCTTDSFYSFHDSAGYRETKINFVNQYVEKIPPILDFSCYNSVNEKLKQLISQCKMSSLFKNEELLYADSYGERVVLSESKDQVKKKKKLEILDREKEARPKKRSAQLAEISVIYEENEGLEKKQNVNFQNQIKKLYKDKQNKILKKQENLEIESEKSNLIPVEKEKVKKIRLSDEADQNSKKKNRKKSSEKLRKAKKSSLNTKLPQSVKKEQTTSFIDQIAKIDKAKGITASKNLKTSFKFTPTNKTICISKIPANDASNSTVKKTNSYLSNSYQFKPPVTKNPLKTSKAANLITGSNGILNKPKNKVKELIEQFGDKFKKAASSISNNKKKMSPVRSSIGARKARLSLSKKETKRKSTKNMSHFVKDMVKEINKTSNGNKSQMNASIQSQKIVNAVKKNPLVVNHKVGTWRCLDKSNIANNSVSKTPNRQKATHATFRINQLNKNIRPEDLKYDSNRCKQLMEAAKKKLADDRNKRIGSTSTVSSLDTSETSVSSLKQDHKSFKMVNTTFDSCLKANPKYAMKKNTTFSIKPNSTIPKQKVTVPPQLTKPNQISEISKTNPNKQCNKPKTLNKNTTIIVNKSQVKTPVRKRSNSVDVTINKAKTENYGIEELGSCDETDDEDEPSKPVPEWAKDHNMIPRVEAQARMFINYTNLFRATANENVELENIFKEKKPRFFFRSSSAEWKSPPVWQTGGLDGNESFRKLANS